MGAAMDSNEQKAREIGNSPKLLKARLMETIGLLTKEVQKDFPRKRLLFDFEQKRLYGKRGYFLQWKVRPNPNGEISYENQQTSRGCVDCRNVKLHTGGIEERSIAWVQLKAYSDELEEMKVNESELLEYINDCWKSFDDLPDGAVLLSDLDAPEYQDNDKDYPARWRMRLALEYLVNCALNLRAGMAKKGNFQYLVFVRE